MQRKSSAFCDHITRRTYDGPEWRQGETYEDRKKRWHAEFIKAKRIVEAFGVEYEPTSEGETLTTHIPER